MLLEHLRDFLDDPVQQLDIRCLTSDEQPELQSICYLLLAAQLSTELIRDEHTCRVFDQRVNVLEAGTELTHISSC